MDNISASLARLGALPASVIAVTAPENESRGQNTPTEA
jgi:hypothetical protein